MLTILSRCGIATLHGRPKHAVWSLALLLVCCSAPEDRPPLVGDDCNGEICVKKAPSGGVRGSSPSSAADDTTQSGDAGATNLLTGTVVVAVSPDLSDTRSLAQEEVSINVEGSAEETVTQGGDFEIRLPSTPPVWLVLRPVSDQSGLLDTWLALEQTSGLATLPIIEQAMIEDVTQALIKNPTLLNPDRGHAILNFFDAKGVPLSGVSVVLDTGVAAYDTGASYSDGLGETDVRGSALLVNLSASSYPGSWEHVTVEYQGTASDVELRLSSGAITLLDVQL